MYKSKYQATFCKYTLHLVTIPHAYIMIYLVNYTVLWGCIFRLYRLLLKSNNSLSISVLFRSDKMQAVPAPLAFMNGAFRCKESNLAPNINSMWQLASPSCLQWFPITGLPPKYSRETSAVNSGKYETRWHKCCIIFPRRYNLSTFNIPLVPTTTYAYGTRHGVFCCGKPCTDFIIFFTIISLTQYQWKNT